MRPTFTTLEVNFQPGKSAWYHFKYWVLGPSIRPHGARGKAVWAFTIQGLMCRVGWHVVGHVVHEPLQLGIHPFMTSAVFKLPWLEIVLLWFKLFLIVDDFSKVTMSFLSTTWWIGHPSLPPKLRIVQVLAHLLKRVLQVPPLSPNQLGFLIMLRH